MTWPTRIRAHDLYGLSMSALDPMTADKTAAVFSLPVDAVKEAIAYDQRKPPEIGQDCEQEERVMEASGRGIASGFATSG